MNRRCHCQVQYANPATPISFRLSVQPSTNIPTQRKDSKYGATTCWTWALATSRPAWTHSAEARIRSKWVNAQWAAVHVRQIQIARDQTHLRAICIARNFLRSMVICSRLPLKSGVCLQLSVLRNWKLSPYRCAKLAPTILHNICTKLLAEAGNP